MKDTTDTMQDLFSVDLACMALSKVFPYREGGKNLWVMLFRV